LIVLAIDTATERVSAAIGGPGGVAGSFAIAAGRRHAETLAPGIEFLTKATNTPLGRVDLIAVDIGPGLFTGLRVGLATAKALAAALDRPTVGVTSLDLLAHPHRGGSRLVAAVVDARRHEVFWSLYRPGPDGCRAINEPAVRTPDALGDELAALGADVVVVGDGGRRHADALQARGGRRIEVASLASAHPSAETLVDLAATAAAAATGAGPAVSAGADLAPVYLRPADVRIGWDQRDGRSGAPLVPGGRPGA